MEADAEGGQAAQQGADVVASLSKVKNLTEHLKRNRHDYGTQRALLRLVGKRRKSLDYLKKVDIERYRAIVKALNLRK